MPYYRPCPVCGAALDPGERCDCRNIEKAALVQQHQGGKAGRLIHAYNEEMRSNAPLVYTRIGRVSSMKRW